MHQVSAIVYDFIWLLPPSLYFFSLGGNGGSYPDMPAALEGMACALDSTMLYVTGGNDGGPAGYNNAVYQYDTQ